MPQEHHDITLVSYNRNSIIQIQKIEDVLSQGNRKQTNYYPQIATDDTL